jgi:hypothetical protein
MILHHIIALYYILFPYITPNNNNVIILYLLTLFGVAFHWILNDNRCCLTEMEKAITGNEDTYIKQVLDPFFNLNNHQCAYIAYAIVLLNGIVAIKKISI